MTNGTGNGNDNGGSNAQIARLSERSFSQQAQLESLQAQVATLETVVIERSGVRSWLPSAAIIAAGVTAIFVGGLQPLKTEDANIRAWITLLKAESKQEVTYVRDDAEKQRGVVWELTQKEITKMRAFQAELDKQRDARIKNLESQHFRNAAE